MLCIDILFHFFETQFPGEQNNAYLMELRELKLITHVNKILDRQTPSELSICCNYCYYCHNYYYCPYLILVLSLLIK